MISNLSTLNEIYPTEIVDLNLKGISPNTSKTSQNTPNTQKVLILQMETLQNTPKTLQTHSNVKGIYGWSKNTSKTPQIGYYILWVKHSKTLQIPFHRQSTLKFCRESYKISVWIKLKSIHAENLRNNTTSEPYRYWNLDLKGILKSFYIESNFLTSWLCLFKIIIRSSWLGCLRRVL